MSKEDLFCVINRTKDGFEFDCGERKKGRCTVSTKGRSGGISVAGSGASGGYSGPVLDCHDEEDLLKVLSEKYGKPVVLKKKES